MKTSNLNYWGISRYWWMVLIIGILMVLCGFAYWFWPVTGYAVASQIFGWMLILAGVVQLCVSAGNNRPTGWGWWLIGGIIDIFIGFMLVRSVILSEAVFPYFIAAVFFFWGISYVFGAVAQSKRRYWWLHLINGILLMVISFFFLEAGWIQNMEMTSFLTSLAFVYWGISISIISCDMRPLTKEERARITPETAGRP